MPRPIVLALLLIAVPAGAQCVDSIPGRLHLRTVLRDPGRVAAMSWYRLQIGAGDSIVSVRDEAVCRRAAEAIASAVAMPQDSFRFVLVRAVTHYVADTDRSMGEWGTRFVFDSLMRLLAPRDTFLAPVSNAGGPPPTESKCFGPDPSIRGKIRNVLTNPRQKWYRDLIGVNGISADEVEHVDDAALCERAIGTIRKCFEGRYPHIQIVLYRVGRYLWAETEWPRAGEWSLVILLDGEATRVWGQW